MTASLETQMPQNVDAERAVLGSMLLEEHVTPSVRLVLRDGDAEFTRENHRVLYSVLLTLYDQHQAFDEIVLQAELNRRGLFEKLGGFDFLGSLLSVVPTALRAQRYAEELHSTYLLRCLFMAGHSIIDRIRQPRAGWTVAEHLQAAEADVLALTERRMTHEAVAIGTLVADVMADLQDGTVRGVRTGFYGLDNLTAGLQPGELTVVAGRPGSGKTAFAVSLASNLLCGNVPVLLFSVEMSRRQMTQRFISQRAAVPMRLFRAKDATPAQSHNIESASGELGRQPLTIDDQSGVRIGELRGKARLAHRAGRAAIVLVDYLQIVRADGRHERRDLEVGSVALGLKNLAKELDIPVVALAQLSRATEAEKGKPGLRHLRESGEIEQHADNIAFLWWDSATQGNPSDGYDAVQTPRLLLAKQRNGPTGEEELVWYPELMRFTSRGAPAPEAPKSEQTNIWDV